MGIGLGILIVGIMGQLVEAFSYHRNEEYRKAVLEAAKVDQNNQNDQPKSDIKPIEPSINNPSEKKEEKPHNKDNKSSTAYEPPEMKDSFHINGDKLILIYKADFLDSVIKNTKTDDFTPDTGRID